MKLKDLNNIVQRLAYGEYADRLRIVSASGNRIILEVEPEEPPVLIAASVLERTPPTL